MSSTSKPIEACPRCHRSSGPSLELCNIPEPLRDMAAGHARICRDCAWEIATGGDEPMVGHRLELVREPGGWRHYLAGEPIACGTSLELYVGQGCWMTGRYECDLGAERPRPMLVLYGPNDRYSERRNGFANEVLENDCPSIAVFGDLHLREEVRLRRPRRQN